MGSKARYEYLKSRHICVQCGKNEAEPGITLCLVCKMDKRERDKNRPKADRSAYRTKRREEQRNAGICTMCGKRRASAGRSTCEWCRARARIRAAKNRLAKGIVPREIFWDGHHCAICGAEELLPEFKVCPQCYPKLRATMLHARSCRQKPNYFEKLQRWGAKKSPTG